MTEADSDALDKEQGRVRIVALTLSGLAALGAVVALGLGAWLWVPGLALLAVGASSWALRMYAAQEARRALQVARGRATQAYADPYDEGPK